MRWQAFSVDQMRDQRAQSGTRFLQVMTELDFSMGLLHGRIGVPVELTNGVSVVYHVANGTGQLSIADADFDVAPGAAFFVRGDIEHRFHSFTSELDAVVVLTQLPPVPSDPEVVAFTLEDMVAARDLEMNVFTPLLETALLSLGMYMLPKGGSDDLLTHDFDEFKIVVNGGGRFDLGSGGFEAGPGSIVFIEDRVPHQFRRISDDIDLLVIWGR